MKTRAAVLSFVLLWSQPAWPCSGATCDQYFGIVPRPDASLPVNAPALGIQQTQYSESSWDAGTSRMALGAMVLGLERLDGGTLFAPIAGPGGEVWALLTDAGIVEGEVLRVYAGGAQCTSEGLLTFGPPAALPMVAATIALDNATVQPGRGNVCGGPLGVVEHFQLRIDATAEMRPWLPLTRWELEIDGENYATSSFGRITSATRIGVPAESGPHPIDTFHVQCVAPPDGGSLDARLDSGPHQVRLLARIVGFPDAVPSNTLTVSPDCTVPDAGQNPAPPPMGCGCDSTPWLSGLLLLSALLRRRGR